MKLTSTFKETLSFNRLQAPIISGTLIFECRECHKINFKTCLTAQMSGRWPDWCTEYISGVHGVHGRTRRGADCRPEARCGCDGPHAVAAVLFWMHSFHPVNVTHARCLCVYSNTRLFARPSDSHSVHLIKDQQGKIVLHFIYEGTPIKYKLASIQISRVGLKSGRLVSWVQGYHKSRRKRDIYVRLLGLKRRCVFHNSCKTGKDFEAEADN